MFERILKRMQKKIRTHQYVVTLHAEEEMNDDDLTPSMMSNGVSSLARCWSARKIE